MAEALSERINPNLLSLFQSICNVFLPYTLNTKVLKLHSHVIIVDIYGADTFLASIPPNTCRADKVVRMSFGRITVMGDTADHHHCWTFVAKDLDLWEGFLV